ncbi:Ger(x)C family spore germination protein [Alkalihalobacillus sp. MEB130]|uniref:Ger(x)C family spore germination protein n=1 Tax=Alkalihalobacillus sp. MEB130 TaxID=2976704 RepID=UPI0028E0398C|nr:Ger(x)C family spore germination protein [Alkalihalobacillus sp. MEB130]MDT8860657.1 Ger(x)C family spore germination protein [Alkalihalobacillus sp. MEB130]
MRNLAIIGAFVLLVLIGCSDPNLEHPVIEDLGMVGVMGFDYVDQESVKISLTLPQPSQDAAEQVQQFSSTVNLPHEAMMDISTLTEKTLTPAQLRVLLFSEEFARKRGLMKIIENLYRDPQVGSNIFVAVTKGNAEDILTGEYKDKPEINIYLTELLTPRTMTAFSPFTTIHDFINRNTDEVSDPATPYIEQVNGSIKITQVALFNDDKMVDTISPEEAKLFEAMKGKKDLPPITFTIPSADGNSQEQFIMKFTTTRVDPQVNGDLSNPEIFIYLYVRGIVVDYDGSRYLSEPANRTDVEGEADKFLEQHVLRTVALFQEQGIDPIGFGDYFRLQNAKGWSKEKWIEAFKQAEITTHVETRIVSTGTIK